MQAIQRVILTGAWSVDDDTLGSLSDDFVFTARNNYLYFKCLLSMNIPNYEYFSFNQEYIVTVIKN